MLFEIMHPEDVKAAIRKRYRSVAAFERAEGLARQSVTELFRGRTSARTLKAIERVLRDEKRRRESIDSDNNEIGTAAHRLNAAAV